MAIAPVRWGLLSTAAINDKLLAAAARSRRLEVLAVASREQARATAYAGERGIDLAYGSYEELLADPGIEAVYISLPNSLHVEWSVRALRAGKHVLCEKPFSRDPKEVEHAFDIAEAEGRILMEAFMYRHHPQTAGLRELVGDGAVGSLRLIRATFSFALGGGPSILLDPALDGGGLMDVGCYCVNAARLLAGEPRRVFAERMAGPSGVDEVFAATMRFPGDVLAQFDCGLRLPDRDELEAIGEAGSVFADDPWHCREPVLELRGGSGSERIAVERADPYLLQLDNMSAAIRGEAEPLLGRADAVGQARAMDALLRSAEAGRPVDL